MVRNHGLRATISLLTLVALVTACSSEDPPQESINRTTDPSTIKSADGGLTLEIPIGAIDADTDIQISALTAAEVDELLQGEAGASVGYRLEPAGLEFSEPVIVTLTFDSADADLASGEAITPYVLLLFNENGQAEVLPDQEMEVTIGDTEIAISAKVQHFSTITAVRHHMIVNFSFPDFASIGTTFDIQAKISNQSKDLVLVDVEGEFYDFHENDAVDLPAAVPFGPSIILAGETISESRFAECYDLGFGDYGMAISFPTAISLGDVDAFIQGDESKATVNIAGGTECNLSGLTPTPSNSYPGLETTIDLFPGSTEKARHALWLADQESDWIAEVEAEAAALFLPSVDIIYAYGGVFEVTEAVRQALFGNTLFECGVEIDGRLTICPDNVMPFPTGEMVMLAMVLAEDVPLNDPDHIYFYSATFDSDGDPGNNYVVFPPYNWDLLQGADRWFSLEYYPEDGEWGAFVTKTEGEFPELIGSALRVVIDRNVVVFFIPLSEFEVPRPGFRLSTFASKGSFESVDSGADVIGADPTEPLIPLPDEAILIDSLEN